MGLHASWKSAHYRYRSQGRTFIDDVETGDLWNFPKGIPHSIQGLEEGCEFLLVFDDGNFSENETFLISDWFAHTPLEVLAKNFGVPESAFANIPTDVDNTRYIFAGKVPGPLASDKMQSPNGSIPQKYSYRMLSQSLLNLKEVKSALLTHPISSSCHNSSCSCRS